MAVSSVSMYALRDTLIFVGVAVLAIAVSANVLQVWENNFSVPACTDCVFKVAGDFLLVQDDTCAQLRRGGIVVAKYGWAYFENRPLKPGEAAKCPYVMYIWVIGGVAYVSCGNVSQPVIGNAVLR